MTLRRSPLHDRHVAADAKLVDFGGWEMPVAYGTGTLAEHAACRESVALFDVSHLGTVSVRGPGARDRLQAALTNDLAKIAVGRAQYTHLLADDGSVVDDLIVWWTGDEEFSVMPNASNTDRVVAALGGDDITSTRAVLAVQGPDARSSVANISPAAAEVGRFRVASVDIDGVGVTVAGTGYTGEDGVEIAVPVEAAGVLWDHLVEAGALPAGLGARDTLRLEAGFPLHGHELGVGITPLQAGLSWVVAWDKGDFPGRTALMAEREAGPARHLVGIRMEGRRPPRHDNPVLVDGHVVGSVTSGNQSPTLGVGIAMAFVPPTVVSGAAVTVDIRGRLESGTVVDMPFVG
jgi:aminomethyltransferase